MELQQKTEKIKTLEKEVAVVEELQSVIKILRQDLANERHKCTELELKNHDMENTVEDLQRQLTMIKKREDMFRQNIQELNFELEKLRENDTNASFMSSGSFNQTIIQELEMKIQQLQSQNDMLKENN